MWTAEERTSFDNMGKKDPAPVLEGFRKDTVELTRNDLLLVYFHGA